MRYAMGANSNAFKAYDLLAAQPLTVKDLPDQVRAGERGGSLQPRHRLQRAGAVR